jgi:hypothetical protein
MDLAEKYKAFEDKFEILAFHDASAKTLAELDEKLEAIVRDRWGGKQLPFPILMDSTGQTIDNYGVNAFPTTILIDPDGNLVKGRAEHKLEQILADMARQQAAADGGH